MCEARTMLDKNLLEEWREYQKQRYIKRNKMANRFACTLLDGDLETQVELFINQSIIEVRRGRFSLIKTTDNLQGYDREGQNIILTLAEEEPLILQFEAPQTLAAAFAQIEIFASERVNLPTPPSSGSDGGDDDINN